jgi:hypothetical protein
VLSGLRSLLAVAIVGVALIAAGCGGSDESSVSATEEWAGGLCSALVAWTDSITATGESLGDPSSLSVDSFQAAMGDAVDATSTLVDDVRALGAPDSESGAQAQEALESIADALADDAAELETQLDEAGDGVTGILSTISAITGTLTSMSTVVSDLFTSLGEIDAEGEFEQAFEAADSCQPLINPS